MSAERNLAVPYVGLADLGLGNQNSQQIALNLKSPIHHVSKLTVYAFDEMGVGVEGDVYSRVS
jgi:hypothetical protein